MNKQLFRLTLIAFALCSFASCTKNDVVQENATESNASEVLVPSNELSSSKYAVPSALLTRYLRLLKRNKTVNIVKPIDKDGITLAYYVEYSGNKGWDLVSADQRIAPILASCPEGTLDLKDKNNPAIQAVQGMINYVDEVRKENVSVQKNCIWEFLEPSNKKSVSTKGGTERDTSTLSRAFGAGMWVPVDTIIEYVDTSSSRVTSTAWGQDSPWSNFTPYSTYPDHCPVGCTPVAIGQILYKYIASDPGQLTIPINANVANTTPSTVSFSNYTTAGWSYLVPNAYGINFFHADSTAIFLSWLGNQMSSNYYADSTDTSYTNGKAVLDNYINYTLESTSLSNNSSTANKEYFCNKVLISIDNGSPVLVFSKATNKKRHTFLIDGYRNTTDMFVIHYVFDPDYEYTMEEWQTLPSWLFDFPPEFGNHGEPCERDIYINLEDALYVKMNWGWQGRLATPNYNNYSFLLRYQTSYSYDGINMTTTSTYNFSWKPDDTYFSIIEHWLHSFSKKN